MRLLSVFVVVILTCSCRASFESIREASGITPGEEQSGDPAVSPGSGDASVDSDDPNGQDLPVGGGEDPNQLPPGGDDIGNDNDDDDDNGNGGNNGGVSIRVETPFGPGEDPACPNGGKKITEGIDRNGNGQLEDSEITSIDYICDDGSEPRCCWCCCDKGGKDDPGQNQDCTSKCCCSGHAGDDPGQNQDGCGSDGYHSGTNCCPSSSYGSDDPGQNQSCCCCCDSNKK